MKTLDELLWPIKIKKPQHSHKPTEYDIFLMQFTEMEKEYLPKIDKIATENCYICCGRSYRYYENGKWSLKTFENPDGVVYMCEIHRATITRECIKCGKQIPINDKYEYAKSRMLLAREKLFKLFKEKYKQ